MSNDSLIKNSSVFIAYMAVWDGEVLIFMDGEVRITMVSHGGMWASEQII